MCQAYEQHDSPLVLCLRCARAGMNVIRRGLFLRGPSSEPMMVDVGSGVLGLAFAFTFFGVGVVQSGGVEL